MNISSLGKSACILIASCFSYSASAATLDVDGAGNLLGAFGVEVGGDLYDVRFLDGTCIALYDGCDELTDFTFQSESTAIAAGQALLDQVLLDGAALYDSNPSLTNGIESTAVGRLFTPHSLSINPLTGTYVVTAASTINNTFETGDVPNGLGGAGAEDDLSAEPSATWAVWNPSPVPAPAALVLFASALAGMTGVRLTRKNKST